jgi:hypothetical protein
MLPHKQLLVCAHVHFATRFGGAEQHESRFSILWEIRASPCLIHNAAQQPTRASQTPALMANRGKHDPVARARVPDELIGAAAKLSLALWCFQND